MTKVVRSLWLEPPAPDNPGMVWWDRWLVAVVIVAALLEGFFRTDLVSAPVAIAIAIAMSFTLLWRRTHPLGMVAITFGAITALNVVAMAIDEPSFGLASMVFVLLFPYALLRWGSGREVVFGLVIILVGYLTGIAADYTTFGEAIAALVFAMSPALIGATVRYWSEARRRDRDRAVLHEREQLARELHDTVAHHVSAIAIRAQAGRAMAATDPDAPLAALEVIEAEASKTLAEMRSMVGALRQGEEPELAPRPGVADIERLGHDIGGGPRVTVEVAGNLDDLAPSVDAALYRVAQESITNAVRHARNATSVAVVVATADDMVHMTVTDDGDRVGSPTSVEPGFGLIGMTERAKLLGGTFDAGPRPDRGWTVAVELPRDGVAR